MYKKNSIMSSFSKTSTVKKTILPFIVLLLLLLSSKAVDVKTLFLAASISKPIAALAALSLVESGEIGLDQDVNHYLEGWEVKENKFTSEEKVTLRRILSQHQMQDSGPSFVLIPN